MRDGQEIINDDKCKTEELKYSNDFIRNIR